MRAPQHGFNLIELMISLAVLGLLITLGAPSFSEWLQNQQIRAAAEATLNGLQVARSEAVARNTSVSFQFIADLTSSCLPASIGPGGFLTSISWVVSVGDPSGACDKKVGDAPAGPVIQSRSGAEATRNAVVTTSPPGATTVTFTSLGGTTGNPDGSLTLQSMTLSNVVLTGSGARPLRIVVNPGGSTRMCDPVAVAPDTRACP
jgi:type IV fimbrial biogenesis protein FimT